METESKSGKWADLFWTVLVMVILMLAMVGGVCIKRGICGELISATRKTNVSIHSWEMPDGSYLYIIEKTIIYGIKENTTEDSQGDQSVSGRTRNRTGRDEESPFSSGIQPL